MAALLGVLAAEATVSAAKPVPIRDEHIARFLPSAAIHALAQDRHGFLWVGTDRGVARFDGSEFSFLIGNPRLDERVQAIIPDAGPDREGLWLGIQREAALLLVRDDKVVQQVDFPGTDETVLNGMILLASGDLLIATSNGPWRWDGHALSRIPADPENPDRSVLAVHEDAARTLWLGMQPGLGRIDRNGFTMIYRGSPVHSLARDPRGMMWLGTPLGPRAFDPVSGQVGDLTSHDSLPFTDTPMLFEKEGTLWLGGSSGLGWVKDGKWIKPLPDALGAEQVTAGHVDREGNVWVGTSASGLMQMKQRRTFMVLDQRDGLPSDLAFSILAARSGGVWLGTTGGLTRIRDGLVTRIALGPSIHSPEIRGLWEDEDGTLWINGYTTGLHRYRNGKHTHVSAELGLPPGGVRTTFRARDGTLWISMESRVLLAVRASGTTLYDKAETRCPSGILAMCQDPSGTVWMGSGARGLCGHDGQKFIRVAKSDGLPSERLNTIKCRANGDLWLGTSDSGLIRKRGATFAQIGVDNGLPYSDVAEMVFDNAGHLWLSSRRGLARVPLHELEAVADGRSVRVHATRLDVDDGLRSNTALWAFPPAGDRSNDGAVWFPTLRGVVTIPHPEGFEPVAPPPVLVDRFVVDGKPLRPSGGVLSLPHGAGNLEIGYAAPTFTDPHRLRFRYQLEGFDRGFQDAGKRRTAFYTNLPPGKFQFTVEVGTDSQAKTSRARVAFALVPPFHRTRGFRIALGGLLLALVGGVVGMRLLQQRARFAAVADERNRIARDMHDTLEQGLVGAKLQMEAAQSLLAPGEASQRHIDRARELLDRSMREAKSSVWALRSGFSDEADLRAALSAVIGQSLLGTRVAFGLAVDGAPFRLEPEAERQVVRIAQEAVTNALKHGNPSRIDITLGFSEQGVSLVCRDDGTGFAHQGNQPGAHYGLRGMRERAESLGGGLTIESRPEAGTTIRATIPGRWRRGGGGHTPAFDTGTAKG